MQKKLTDSGTMKWIIYSVYSALYDGDYKFFEETLGQNMMMIIESRMGITFNKLEELVKEKKLEPLTKISDEDLANYTVKELALKYKTTPGRVRWYIDKNHLSYKRIYKKAGVDNG